MSELKCFEGTKTKTPKILKLYKSVMTIQPSSVQAERIFSTAGLFSTKLRSRISDRILDSLYFLRNFFKNN